jgi:hypothetical protein
MFSCRPPQRRTRSAEVKHIRRYDTSNSSSLLSDLRFDGSHEGVREVISVAESRTRELIEVVILGLGFRVAGGSAERRGLISARRAQRSPGRG